MTRNREIFLGFVVLVVGTMCAATMARTLKMQGSEAAAWAQAIGTVGAIWVGLASISQRKSELRDEQRRAVGSALLAVSHGLAILKMVDQALRSDVALRGLNIIGISKSAAPQLRLLEEFPAYQVNDPLVGHHVTLVGSIVRSVVEWEALLARAERDRQIRATLLAEMAEKIDMAEQAQTAVHASRQAL